MTLGTTSRSTPTATARRPARRFSTWRRLLAAALATSAAAGLAGCGLQTSAGQVQAGVLAGELTDAPSLEGAEISIGSKNFSENILLGKIALILFKSAGAEVSDFTNIPGSASARQAQISGDIDAMWEYTGTGWLVYLGEPEAIPDEQEQYEAVRDADLEQNQLVWLPPAPMNNTYAFAITQETAEEYRITKSSEIDQIPVEDRTMCVEGEFRNRADGLPGFLEAYDVPLDDPQGLPPDNLRTYQTGAIYDATASGACTLGEVFTTDGRILALDLTVLEDDRQYFPVYNVSLVVREELYEEYPEIEEILAPVAARLTDEVLIGLNAKIDVEGQEPNQVAYDWLLQEGFIEAQ